MRPLERTLGYVAAAALFAMMIVTFADVVGRKLFVSIPGSLEVTELLMLVVIFVGLPLASLKGEHVFFDLLTSSFPTGCVTGRRCSPTRSARRCWRARPGSSGSGRVGRRRRATRPPSC
jgi:hypothetical protein